MNPLAKELNTIIRQEAPSVYDLLSESGRHLFFPSKGILAQATEAKGKKINATIGIALDDEGIPLHLNSLSDLINMKPGSVFPYATSAGRPDLRQKWSEKLLEKNPDLKGRSYSLPLVTCALSHGISIASRLFMNEGDSVITPDMYWGNYNLLIKETYKVDFDTYPFFDGDKMNLQGLEERLVNPEKTGKKIVCLNYPNNPTGYTPTIKEAQRIRDMILKSAEQGNKIVVLCDDAYFGLVYEESVERQSLFTYLADLHENVLAIKIDGATKEDYVWGFRVGFVTYSGKACTPDVYKALEQKTSGAIRASISSAPNLSQALLLEAYNDPGYEADKKRSHDLLESRYNKVKEVLEMHGEKYSPYFKPLPFNSGYFMCIQLSEKLDGDKLRRHLIENYETGTIFIRGVLRLAFSCVPETRIEELFENVYHACQDIT